MSKTIQLRYGYYITGMLRADHQIAGRGACTIDKLVETVTKDILLSYSNVRVSKSGIHIELRTWIVSEGKTGKRFVHEGGCHASDAPVKARTELLVNQTIIELKEYLGKKFPAKPETPEEIRARLWSEGQKAIALTKQAKKMLSIAFKPSRHKTTADAKMAHKAAYEAYMRGKKEQGPASSPQASGGAVPPPSRAHNGRATPPPEACEETLVALSPGELLSELMTAFSGGEGKELASTIGAAMKTLDPGSIASVLPMIKPIAQQFSAGLREAGYDIPGVFDSDDDPSEDAQESGDKTDGAT